MATTAFNAGFTASSCLKQRVVISTEVMRRLRIADAISFADFVSQHELGGRFFMLKGSGGDPSHCCAAMLSGITRGQRISVRNGDGGESQQKSRTSRHMKEIEGADKRPRKAKTPMQAEKTEHEVRRYMRMIKEVHCSRRESILLA